MKANSEIENIVYEFNHGKIEGAFFQISKLIKKYPDNLEFLYLYAKMCNQVNRLDESERVSLFLLSKNGNSIEYLQNLHSTYLKKNNVSKSEPLVKKILQIDNKNFGALRDLGYIEYLKGNIESAYITLKKIVNTKTTDPFALNIFGLIFLKKNLFQDAINIFNQAISHNPKYIDSYNNIGKVYFDLEDLDRAFIFFKKAYKIINNNSKTLINIGNFLSLRDKNFYAIKAYKKALLNDPHNIEVYSNIGLAYARNRDFKNAKKFYELAQKNNNVSPSLNLSMAYLYMYKNNFERAWDFFESRKHNSKFKQKESLINKSSVAKKETIISKKILVLREQGIGEEILFSSMYKELIALNNNLKIETDHRLISVFERSFQNKVFVPDGYYSKNEEVLKNFDSVIFAGSLCAYFRKNKKNFLKKPYLIADQMKAQKIKENQIFSRSQLRVGLSWKSVVSVYGKLKSLTLSDFAPLFKKERKFINLQYGEVEEEINLEKNNNLALYSFDKIDLFNDLEGLMSILENIDVFVTVSNSTAHIAAAMGVKTLLICPKKSSTYFYWSNENNITPWYNNVEIFLVNKSLEITLDKIDKVLNSL